ncbi:MAG: hypothetical protein ACP5U1_04395 [Desulfomonilaceae bacterium]
MEPEIKLLKTFNGKPVFEQVELTDEREIGSLDKAIILANESKQSGISQFEPVKIESQGPDLSSETISSTADVERLSFAFQAVSPPIVPMSLAVIAFLIAVTLGHM